MIRVIFYGNPPELTGFGISGHGARHPFDKKGERVCASVSSAAYMAANTITEICECDADISEDNGYLKMKIDNVNESAEAVLKGFKLHMENLHEQYPEFIQI